MKKIYEKQTEEQLVASYREGDFTAMEFLCKRYQPIVSRYSERYFIRGCDEQDVIQEGMIGLFKAAQDYDASRGVPFRAFAEVCILRQIYKAIDAAERQKNQPLNSYIPIAQSEEDVADALSKESYILADCILADENRNPEVLLLDSEKSLKVIDLAVKALSKMELEVFFYMMQGLDYRAIAARMDKSEKSIDNAMQRIRKKMRQEL